MDRISQKMAWLVVLVAALSGFALAQQYSYRVQANVPVDFYAGGQLRSAGDYLFTVNYGNNAVTITNLGNNHSSVVLASPIEYASTGYDRMYSGTVVEFNSVGGKYELADIQTRTNGVRFTSQNPHRQVAENSGTVRVMAALR